MRSPAVNTDSRLRLWRHIRAYAVPPSMIESADARRRAGDWAGACAAARVEVDLNVRAVARTHGTALAAELRSDLRHLAPDLLRWHLPRVAPDGLLRPALTVGLARYAAADGPLWLVVRTAPAWADAGQRISLALWSARPGEGRHPHPRFRLDLHRHLWDARRAPELRSRAGLPGTAAPGRDAGPPVPPGDPVRLDRLRERGCAVDRWVAEAALLPRARGGAVAIRLGAHEHLVLRIPGDAPPVLVPARGRGLPVLPDAAVWQPPDLTLLRAGMITPDELHPLVAAALAPGRRTTGPVPAPTPPPTVRTVRCRDADHRIGVVDGVLRPLDHDPAEIRREELLAALTGTPLPCLRVIDELHRHPATLDDVRARLDHGDTEGALRTVESLLGPAATLRDGPLRHELRAAAHQRLVYGMYRAGLTPTGPTHDPAHQRAPRSDPFAHRDPGRSRRPRPRRRR
ncbi:hypothetical protein [Catenuloplanes atrovinosus]|uniref:Uncharacterized protein n=1 Tax=Catenuloplanes atrovinosus TaxID=137266 RepID=A0AAE3YQ44_9ACTN|nr:hypothetical protein [Catenuloplanes atrovinosus]MDR7277774.1 hypothetical protein [Catenuloplanes atrovinosus]